MLDHFYEPSLSYAVTCTIVRRRDFFRIQANQEPTLARLEYPGWLETMTRNARSFLKYFSRAVSRRFALLRRRFKFRSVVSDGKKAGRAPRPVRGRAWNKDLRKSRGEHGNERKREHEKQRRMINERRRGSGRVAHTSRSTSSLKFASARRANVDWGLNADWLMPRSTSDTDSPIARRWLRRACAPLPSRIVPLAFQLRPRMKRHSFQFCVMIFNC